MDYPTDLKYSNEHEYVRLAGDIATIGITIYAVQQLGDIVFVELPKVDAQVTKTEPVGSIESVKAVSEVYVPVTGTIVEINSAVDDDPDLVNDDPFGEGWLFKVRIDDPSDLDDLMTDSQYQEFIGGY